MKRMWKLLHGLYQTNMEVGGRNVECTFHAGDTFETEADLSAFNGRGMQAKFELIDSTVLDENSKLRAEIDELRKLLALQEA